MRQKEHYFDSSAFPQKFLFSKLVRNMAREWLSLCRSWDRTLDGSKKQTAAFSRNEQMDTLNRSIELNPAGQNSQHDLQKVQALILGM